MPAGTQAARRPITSCLPTVSGNALLGATLTCAEGTWAGSPAPALTYQWLRDGTDIPSATASTYVVVEADQGHSLSCEVTAINGEGVASEGQCQHHRNPRGGAGKHGTAAGIRHAGRRRIAGMPARRLERIAAADVRIPVVAQRCEHRRPRPRAAIPWRRRTVASRSHAGSRPGTARAPRKRRAPTRSKSPATSHRTQSPPKSLGSPAVGESLTCSPGTWSGQPPPTYAYQWLLAGVDIPGSDDEHVQRGPRRPRPLAACDGDRAATAKGRARPPARASTWPESGQRTSNRRRYPGSRRWGSS